MSFDDDQQDILTIGLLLHLIVHFHMSYEILRASFSEGITLTLLITLMIFLISSLKDESGIIANKHTFLVRIY